MRWLDVCGAPGVGKSALCDPLWGPHDIPIVDTPAPAEWHDFCNEVTRLLCVVREHPSFTAAVRMNRRSMRKMAIVSEMDGDKPYIQTGFVQRGLGFGWRLVDMGKPVEELSHFFRLMPVSLGVAYLSTDAETLKQRNKARETVKATAHENRAFMGPLMAPAIEFAKEVLSERGVPAIEIETTGDIEQARSRLTGFADNRMRDLDSTPPALVLGHMHARNASAAGPGGKAPVVSPPVWW